MADRGQIVVKTYRGSQSAAMASFQKDANKLAAEGYVPITQTWVPGTYGCLSFLGALVLCFVIIGFIIFVYMLIVKPEGTLSVTYSRLNPPQAVPGR